jgi:hypothetical protein
MTMALSTVFLPKVAYPFGKGLLPKVAYPFGKGLLPKVAYPFGMVALPMGLLPKVFLRTADSHPIVAHKVSQIV